MTFSLSPSTLSLLKECPRCFWMHLHGMKRPETIFPSLPSGMDRVLKEHFDGFREKKGLPPELCSLDDGTHLFGDAKKLKEWRNARKGISWKDGDGNLFHGGIDELLEKKGKLAVLDFKTRGYPVKDDTAGHYQDQLDIYNLLFRKNGFSTEDFAYLLFYHPLKVWEDGKVSFHAELVRMKVNVKNAEQIFKNALEVLKVPMPKAEPGCGFCGRCEKSSIFPVAR